MKNLLNKLLNKLLKNLPAKLPKKQPANLPAKRLTTALLATLLCGCAGSWAEENQNSPGDLLDACIRAADVIWNQGIDTGYEEASGGWGGEPELPAGSDRDTLQGYLSEVTRFSGIPVSYDGRNVQIRMGDMEGLHISIPEIRSLSKQIEQFAKDLAGRQAARMAANKGERLYEPEVIENIYRFAKWMQTLVVDIDDMGFPEDEPIAIEISRPGDADSFSAAPAGEPAEEVTLPSFRFDGLVFSDEYVRTEEKDEIQVQDLAAEGAPVVTMVYMDHTTYYYAANGDCVRSVTEHKGTRNGVLEATGTTERRYARIGDTDYIAVISTGHYENPYINYFLDSTTYKVLHNDREYEVDAEGRLLPEKTE